MTEWMNWEDEVSQHVTELLNEVSVSLSPLDCSPEEMERYREDAHRQVESSFEGMKNAMNVGYDPSWMQIRTILDSIELWMEELMMRLMYHKVLGNSRRHVILSFLRAYAKKINLSGVNDDMLESLVMMVTWQTRKETE